MMVGEQEYKIKMNVRTWDGKEGVVVAGNDNGRISEFVPIETALKYHLNCSDPSEVREVVLTELNCLHLNLDKFKGVERISFDKNGRFLKCVGLLLPSKIAYTLEDVPVNTVTKIRCSSGTTITNMEELLEKNRFILMSDGGGLIADKIHLDAMISASIYKYQIGEPS